MTSSKKGFITKDEKDALLSELHTTMNHVGRLPGLIFAPVIAYVSAHYAKIPADRKSHLKNILEELKAGGSEGVDKLKDRFKHMLPNSPASKKKAGKPTGAKGKPSAFSKGMAKWGKVIKEKASSMGQSAVASAKKKAATATKKAATSLKKKPLVKKAMKKKAAMTKAVNKTVKKVAAKKTTKHKA